MFGLVKKEQNAQTEYRNSRYCNIIPPLQFSKIKNGTTENRNNDWTVIGSIEVKQQWEKHIKQDYGRYIPIDEKTTYAIIIQGCQIAEYIKCVYLPPLYKKINVAKVLKTTYIGIIRQKRWAKKTHGLFFFQEKHKE